ncbi:prepilin-type N-terminal cleavage/methylation domain-containing protein [Patescibacteria group bacterium]
MRKGFSLVEIIIVVSIIVAIATFVLGTQFGSRDLTTFNNSSSEVVGLLQQARNLALSGQAYPDYTDYDNDGLFSNDGDEILANGYILNFKLGDPTIVSLYADVYSSDIGQLDPGEKKDKLIDEVELLENMKIEAIAIKQNGSENVSVTFDNNDFRIMYSTPDAQFTVVDNDLNSIQLKFSQVNSEDEDIRSKYIYMHYLYGIPEVFSDPYFE